MINIQSPIQCCGCSACYAICKHNAIQMQPDKLGFLYPSVNPTLCIDCGLCNKVCMFVKPRKEINDTSTIVAYAVQHKELEEVKTSRSGAVFIALSDWILRQSGVVYGVGYKTAFIVSHKRAETKIQRDEFKGSKYAQSSMGNIFRQVKDDLTQNRIVLFSGTPCQIDGLKSFLGKWASHHNLYLIDIVCHGVGSPAIWRDYITYLERSYKQQIVSLSFRDKDLFGWDGLHKESFIFTDGKKRTFQYTYYSDIHLRQSCNVCPYANLARVSDITIGDFWGFERTCVNWEQAKQGISLAICSTDKGKFLFQEVTTALRYAEVKLEDIIQPNLLHPTPLHPDRDCFEQDYSLHGFRYIQKKYGEIGLKYHVSRFKRIVKRVFKL